MQTDRHAHPLSGATPEAAAHYERAVRSLNIYTGDPVAHADDAIAAAPDFAMAHLLKAWLFGVATEPAAAAEARGIVAHAAKLAHNDREDGHLASLERLMAGDWNGAATALDHHSIRYPRDVVALQAGILLDFYRGNPRAMRDRIARALPAWSREDADYPLILGMHSFGLEETGDYARAEEAGRAAVEGEPLDCWAHHAMAHVFEMQGRTAEGAAWMADREPHWAAPDNFFRVHNWWHRALFHIDLGETGRALAIYDKEIRGEPSEVALDLVDASAMLWRLHLLGVDVGDRWQNVAAAWDQHADGRLYPFNDWHAAMAYLGAGRDEEVERIVKTLEDVAGGAGEPAQWGRDVALPLVGGFTAFWRGDFERAVEALHGVRYIAHRFGGSHAQRDIIDWTLTEAAVRGGLTAAAEALVGERLELKPNSPVNLAFRNRARAGQAAQEAA